jgi:hypothetical protein
MGGVKPRLRDKAALITGGEGSIGLPTARDVRPAAVDGGMSI